MLTRRTVIEAIRETIYGTNPGYTGANTILAYDVEFDDKAEKLEREVLRDSLSPMPHVMGLKEVGLSFKTELKGPGGTLVTSTPELQALIAGCGFDTGTINGTAMIFAPVSDESKMSSVSMGVFKDGNFHPITGARGTLKITGEAGKYAVCEWGFKGIHGTVAASALPDVSGVQTTKPPVCYAASFQIGGFSPVTSKLEIDTGNNLIRRDDINAATGVKECRITGRKGKLSWDMDASIEATNPNWGDLFGDVVDTYSIQIGSTSANKIVISGYFQYESNKYADTDGVSKYDCVAALVSSDASSQNDEISIKFA